VPAAGIRRQVAAPDSPIGVVGRSVTALAVAIPPGLTEMCAALDRQLDPPVQLVKYRLGAAQSRYSSV